MHPDGEREYQRELVKHMTYFRVTKEVEKVNTAQARFVPCGQSFNKLMTELSK